MPEYVSNENKYSDSVTSDAAVKASTNVMEDHIMNLHNSLSELSDAVTIMSARLAFYSSSASQSAEEALTDPLAPECSQFEETLLSIANRIKFNTDRVNRMLKELRL